MREQVVIGVDEVGINDYNICGDDLTAVENNACGTAGVGGELDGGYGGRKTVCDTVALTDADKSCNDAMEAASWVPYSFCELSVLEKTVCTRSIEWRHAHVHASKCENTTEPFCPKVLRGAGVNAFERMQSEDMAKK